MKINKWFLMIAFMASLFLASNIDAKDTSFLHSEKVGQGLANGLNFEGQWVWTHYVQGTGVPTPPTGTIYVYAKTDGLYMKDDTGSETQISEGSGLHGLNTALSNPDSPIVISLSNNDAGARNTIFGATAGTNIQSGATDNTLFSQQAGNAITTGDRNTFLGFNTGSTLQTGSGNVLLGIGADVPASDTNNYMNLGDASIQVDMLGHFTVLGNDTVEKPLGPETLTVHGSMKFGSGAAVDIIMDGDASTENLFIGDVAPAAIGEEVIRIGFNSGTTMGAGATENILIGDNVAPLLPFDAERNFMIGHDIFTGITLTASHNIVFGHIPALNVTQPVENVILGNNLLSSAATQCDRNVIIGNGIAGGATQITENVLIGHNIDLSDVGTTFNRSIIIGQQTQAITGVNNDFLNIGDLIFGDLANGFVRIGGPITKPTTDEFTVVGTIACIDIIATEEINGMRIDANSTSFSFAEGGNDILISNMVRLGHGALSSPSLTGDQNIAIGTDAQEDTTTGNENVSVGQNTLWHLTTGVENAAFGHGAMDSVLGDSSNNAAFGQLAASDFTDGISNVWLGDNAGDGHQSGDFNVFIGAGVDSPSADVDNFVNINNSLYGNSSQNRWVIGGSPVKPTGNSQLELDSGLANLLLNRVSTTNDSGFNVAGEFWYNTTGNEFRGVENGTQVSFDTSTVLEASCINDPNIISKNVSKNTMVNTIRELLERVEALESPGVILNRRVDALEARDKLLRGKIMVLQPAEAEDLW